MNDVNTNQLHPIATEASALFLQGKRTFTAEAIAKLESELDKIRERPELGPAIASLVQVAQHLDKNEGAQAASLALLRVAMTQTSSLEALNKKAKLVQEDEARRKQKAFAKFSGKS
jgi:hypothetical protein